MAERAVPFAVLAPGGQSGNFWIYPHITQITFSCFGHGLFNNAVLDKILFYHTIKCGDNDLLRTGTACSKALR